VKERPQSAERTQPEPRADPWQLELFESRSVTGPVAPLGERDQADHVVQARQE
jgi:hypothetical protein